MKRTVNSFYDVEMVKQNAIDVDIAVSQIQSTLQNADALVERYLQSSKRDKQLAIGSLILFENKPSRFSEDQKSTFEVFELRNGEKILVAQYQ